MRVPNPNHFIRKTFPGDKLPGIDPDIFFYEVEYNDKSDNGDDAAILIIHIKIYKASTDTNQKNQKLIFSVIKYVGHQGPKVIRMLQNMTVSVFENLSITTWKVIDQKFIFTDQILNGPSLTKFSNDVLSFKYITRDESGD